MCKKASPDYKVFSFVLCIKCKWETGVKTMKNKPSLFVVNFRNMNVV